jgi:hypothetical protein
VVTTKKEADARSAYQFEFGKIAEDSSYSAQTYYEASKAAEFWGKSIVFVPALVASVSSLLIAFGESKLWGIPAAFSAAITATASFLGTQRRAASFRASGNNFTKIRHEAKMWHDSLVRIRTEDESFETLNNLRKEYASAVDQVDIPSGRYFAKAQARIKKGVLAYDDEAVPGSPSSS